MPAIAFDTLKFVKRLRTQALMKKRQKPSLMPLKEWYEAGLSDLATKQDIKELELRLTGEIKLLF